MPVFFVLESSAQDLCFVVCGYETNHSTNRSPGKCVNVNKISLLVNTIVSHLRGPEINVYKSTAEAMLMKQQGTLVMLCHDLPWHHGGCCYRRSVHITSCLILSKNRI